ncbi:mitochondrial import inner membrane translocase subunit TIM14 [Lobaria immixta]|nr:mitochondrial import inner membrane translocase subunit TIM14 [Lobaria immixta]
MSAVVAVGIGVAAAAFFGRAGLVAFRRYRGGATAAGVLGKAYYKAEVNLRLTALDEVDSCLRKLLGSERSLTKEKIRKNHRQLMLLNHPDRGGSPYLATKVNEAKEFLEKHQ